MQTKNFEEENEKNILYIDNDLIEFLIKAQQQGFNCLDLSKRNLKEFPNQILEFTSLQYLYLEGNQLTQLPSDLFLRLPHLKWLDLRNNQLTSIPNDGLIKHRSLQYLLLSGNHLRSLPFELGNVRTLSALNLDGNPLKYPPFDVIKRGVKAIQNYLRQQLPSSDESPLLSDIEEQQLTPRYTPSRLMFSARKSNSETGFYEPTQTQTQTNPLPPHLQSCIQYKRVNYSPSRPSTSIRSRPQSEMRLPQVKSKNSFTKPTELESELTFSHEPSLIHLKHRSKKSIEDQTDFRGKTFVTSQVFEEPMIHTPYHVDSDYIQMLNKTPPKKIVLDKRQDHITNDEARRKHDQQIQDRIRQITDQMLRRRLEARSSLFDETRQVRMELREIRRLESNVSKQTRIKTHNNSKIRKE